MSFIITSPIKNRAWILPHYLQCVENIAPDGAIFIDDCSSDETYSILNMFAKKHSWVELIRNKVNIDNNTSSRDAKDRIKIYEHLSELRNSLIGYLAQYKDSYQLSIDSDILFCSDLFKVLSTHKKHYTASIIYNTRTISKKEIVTGHQMLEQHCNFGITDKNKSFVSIKDYQLNTVYKVGITGAVYLADRFTLESGARYSSSKQGEDIGYALSLQAKGIDEYVDTTIRCVHVMRPNQLQVGLESFEFLQSRTKE